MWQSWNSDAHLPDSWPFVIILILTSDVITFSTSRDALSIPPHPGACWELGTGLGGGAAVLVGGSMCRRGLVAGLRAGLSAGGSGRQRIGLEWRCGAGGSGDSVVGEDVGGGRWPLAEAETALPMLAEAKGAGK
jgi:hypothetical protein